MVMMHLYPRYGMGSHQSNNTHPWVMHSPILCSGNDAAIFCRIAWANRVFRCAAGFGRTRKCKRGMGRFVIILNWRRGDNVFCWRSNPTFSNANTSSRVRFVPAFTGDTLRRFGQSNTHQLMPSAHNQNFERMWLLEQYSFFIPM